MDNEAVPIIRLEVQNLKHAVLSHMGVIGSQLGEMIEARIDESINTMPIDTLINDAIKECIEDVIRDYFTKGEGYKAIKESVNKSFKK
jgi:hypothetical protein